MHTFKYIHENESKHSEMGPVRQNPIQRPVRSVHMCVHCTVHNCCTQYCTEQTSIFPLTLQTISQLITVVISPVAAIATRVFSHLFIISVCRTGNNKLT